ncbi:hypothetical protein [Klebsiella quasipneumoniae]|uniref:hypothetical protein n=1 Tax=Klebsiella quasipneumoniae TaxID=1463165 RepID=UPI0015DD029D|nr:hypothetical protein [Klebsiella quasipneumoniae]BBR13393.1 hypothetical protein WP3S18E03_06510 [Klebsiella quasipneumoniae]
MRKISSVTDTADSNGEFTQGNVANGVSPTILVADIFNTWQREMVGVVEGSGRQLEPENDGQLNEVIDELRITALLSEPIVGALTSQGYCIIPTRTPSGEKKILLFKWELPLLIHHQVMFSIRYLFLSGLLLLLLRSTQMEIVTCP